jgi:hypothetical protein
MKKIIFSLLLLSSALSHSQNVYNLAVSQGNYTDLTEATSLNNATVWQYDQFGPVTLPFYFQVGDQMVDRFAFVDDDILLLTPNATLDSEEGLFGLLTSGAFIQDRTYSTGVSGSSISYKTEGTAGNRIFKLEIKNAGLEDALFLGFTEDHFYINVQIWLYESDRSIEYRYGSHNITNPSFINEGEIQIGVFGDSFAGILTGSTTAPNYQEFTPANPPGDDFQPTVDEFPATGTIYHFYNSLAGTASYTKFDLAVYPNPAISNLYISTNSGNSVNYDIYTVLGSKVLSGKLNSTITQINIETLDKGVYFLTIDGATKKFIKN